MTGKILAKRVRCRVSIVVFPLLAKAALGLEEQGWERYCKSILGMCN